MSQTKSEMEMCICFVYLGLVLLVTTLWGVRVEPQNKVGWDATSEEILGLALESWWLWREAPDWVSEILNCVPHEVLSLNEAFITTPPHEKAQACVEQLWLVKGERHVRISLYTCVCIMKQHNISQIMIRIKIETDVKRSRQWVFIQHNTLRMC